MKSVKTVQFNSPAVMILRALRAHDGGFVSGEHLAQSLKLSRVAIWKRIEKLRNEGHPISAVRRKGYQMQSHGSPPTAAGILSRTTPDSGLQSLYYFEDSPSTNDAAMKLLAGGVRAPFACVTRRQPGGKGRRGRSWIGDSTGNVYTTLATRPMISPRMVGLLPIRVGLNLCRRLSAETSLPIRLKWPNDLLLHEKKIAGMLAESTFETDRITSLVFGVGLNANLPREDLAPEIRESATSLSIESQRIWDLEGLTAAVTEEVLQAIDECSRGIDENRMADDWKTFAAYQGEAVSVTENDNRAIQGTLAGIDRSGSLLLRTGDGSLRSFRAGDVSLRKEFNS